MLLGNNTPYFGSDGPNEVTIPETEVWGCVKDTQKKAVIWKQKMHVNTNLGVCWQLPTIYYIKWYCNSHRLYITMYLTLLQNIDVSFNDNHHKPQVHSTGGYHPKAFVN